MSWRSITFESVLSPNVPLTPLGITASTASKTLFSKSLFKRNSGVKTSLAIGCKWHKIKVQMRRGLIHVEVCREHFYVRIPLLLKILHILIQHLSGKLTILRNRRHIVLVPNLQMTSWKSFSCLPCGFFHNNYQFGGRRVSVLRYIFPELHQKRS
jgi:hypothetical protein